MVNNGGKPSWICLRKPLGSVTETPRLGFSWWKQFFFTQNSWNTSPGASGILRTAPFSLFIGKRGRRLPPSSPRRAGLLPPEATQLQKNILEGPIQHFKIVICTPLILISSPTFFHNLWKCYGSLREPYRTWFSSFFLFPLTRIKLNILI